MLKWCLEIFCKVCAKLWNCQFLDLSCGAFASNSFIMVFLKIWYYFYAHTRKGIKILYCNSLLVQKINMDKNTLPLVYARHLSLYFVIDKWHTCLCCTKNAHRRHLSWSNICNFWLIIEQIKFASEKENLSVYKCKKKLSNSNFYRKWF